MRVTKAKDRSRLIAAARGDLACDLTVENIQFFNVFTGEIYPASVDVLDGFVVRVREEGQEAARSAKMHYDGKGNYLIPGFIDTHMHVESTMMIPENLSRAILPWGTTTICTDPHEIGNVMGIEGVKFMLESAKKSKLRQYVLAPSCVPAVPGLETSGAVFRAEEIGTILDMDNVVGIAEVMDYVGVVHDSERMHSIIDEGLKRGMFIQGHAPYIRGGELAAYLIGGPVSDHESVCAAEVQEKLRAGMHINLRASSLIDNLSALADGCRNHPWKDFVSICTDDVHAAELLTVGHINKVVGKAVRSGLDGREVIKMATFNAARELHFDDLGAIAPGYIADMQLVPALDGSKPLAVFVEGELVAENGVYVGGDAMGEEYDLPNTVNVPQLRTEEDFVLRVPAEHTGDTITVNVLEPADENGVLRRAVPTVLPVTNGAVDISAHPELTMVCCANRYGTGTKTIAVYRNFGLEKGALAATVSHDSHNLTVCYKNTADALLAAETLKGCGGGICAACDGEETHLTLPAAGLMSQRPCAEVAAEVKKTQCAVSAISGGKLPILASAIMALPVLSGTVITDLGLVDGICQEFVPVFAE